MVFWKGNATPALLCSLVVVGQGKGREDKEEREEWAGNNSKHGFTTEHFLYCKASITISVCSAKY